MLPIRIHLILAVASVGSTFAVPPFRLPLRAISTPLPTSHSPLPVQTTQFINPSNQHPGSFNTYQPRTWLPINSPVNPTLATSLTLWATYYHIHQAQSVPNGESLLNKQGQRLGPTLTTQDWCRAALEGTVQISDTRGFQTTYNFASRGSDPQVDCSAFFPKLSATVLEKMSRVRFAAATTLYGYGTDGMTLVPYRTIAVDRSQIPIGSVIYIPEARGKTVTLPSGDRVVHDGYFYAADVGSAIQGNHIDIFLGTSRNNPFPFVTSTPNQPFQAFLVQDPRIAQALHQLHRSPTTGY